MQNVGAINMLIRCQNRDVRNTGLVTIIQFRRVLCAVFPYLTESEVKSILREIEVSDGKIAYAAAIAEICGQ